MTATLINRIMIDRLEELARVTKAIADASGNFASFGFFAREDASAKVLTFKVEGIKKDDARKVFGTAIKKFWDIRQS